MAQGGGQMSWDRSRYPSDWPVIVARIRVRAKGRCECTGECGLHRTHPGPRRCTERQGTPAKWARGRVMLTTAHVNNPDPQDCRDDNLKQMCQRCHLRIDLPLHMKHAALTRDRKRGQIRFGFAAT